MPEWTIGHGQGYEKVQGLLQNELGQRGKRGLRVQLSKVEETVGQGGALSQAAKIALLRLTPIVPYSISNYLLGLTRVGYLRFIIGTVLGITPWMIFYSFVGNTGRALLQNGLSIETVLKTLTQEIASDSTISYIELALVGTFALLLIVRAFRELKQGWEE